VSGLKYWIWLSSLTGIGALTAGRLIKEFCSPEQVFFADEKAYAGIEELRKSDIAALMDKNLARARKALSVCEENGYRIITIQDTEYPARLKNLYDPPIILYIRGRLPIIDDEAAVAIVGTRNCTPYGSISAERMGYELTRDGCLIVSGLAKGVDTAAARGALRAGGRVVGVVGSGLDIVYPAENKALFDDVASVGAIISEYAPGTPAVAKHFPARNRIISGISVGVTVIEAPLQSGALITAARALDQGRDVFALPGNVDSPACEGSNRLLREGAIIVTSGQEIAEEYAALFPDKINITVRKEKVALGAKQAERLVRSVAQGDKIRQELPKKVIDNTEPVEYIDLVKLKKSLTDDEFGVVSAISGVKTHIDNIIADSGIPASSALSILTMLEIKGIVIQTKGKYFSLAQTIIQSQIE
jgi:DNA processing protein